MVRSILAALLLFAGLAACPPSASTVDSGVPPQDAGTNGADAGVAVDLSGSRQGASLAVIDFDGDAIPDKVVGAPFASHQGHRGAALVYRGLPQGAFAFDPVVLTGGDSFGAVLTSLGDLDGDGAKDYAISATHGDGSTGMSGVVTLHRGGQRGALLATVSAGGPSAKFGYAVASGDFDADGKPDVAVGAPFDSPTPALYQAGQVFVFFGPEFTRQVKIAATASTRVIGWALAAGDLSGDGTADLVLGASGKAVAFFGKPGFDPNLAAPDLSVRSTAANFSRSLLVLDDWTGDGLGELVIGAPTSAAGQDRDVGAFFVIKGAAATRALDLGASPPPADLLGTVKGAAAFSRLGVQLASTRDMDGDGRRELVVSAPMSDVAVNDLVGKVYLFKSASPLELTQATSFAGTERSGWFGAALAPTGDGRLFVGAPRAQAEAGAVQLIDLATGQQVQSGSSGGATGSAGCHCDETGECHC